MATNQLNIPGRIKVGYLVRPDIIKTTYTGRLAFVIYYDHKGVLRKQQSWNGWRDKKLGDHEFDNVPTEGFVLNKGVGGVRQSYGWNTRNEYIRVYDPRNFEIEISVENLLFILRECNCSKGKGLEGKFVYAWNGQQLVLLPECCEDYQKSVAFTKLQSASVKAKEMIPGAVYQTKKQELLIYIGRLNHYTTARPKSEKKADHTGLKKVHVFCKADAPHDFLYLDSCASIANLHSDVVVSNYPELAQKYYESTYGSKIVELFYQTIPDAGGDKFYSVIHSREGESDSYIEMRPHYHTYYNHEIGDYVRAGDGRYEYITISSRVGLLPTGVLFYEPIESYMLDPQRPCSANRLPYRGYSYRYGYGYGRERESDMHHILAWSNPENKTLFARLESGKVFVVSSGRLMDVPSAVKECAVECSE